MKQIALSTVVPAVLACILTGCSGDDNPWQGSTDGGALKLSLEADGRIAASTRADDTKSPIVPLVSEFGITLSRTDGSYTKKWDKLENFNKEELFPIGEYKIEANYGDREVEGFEHPWFYASDNVSVTAGDQKNVSLTATLANAMVSIRYTDDFRQNFSAYSSAVRSVGHDFIVFAQGEDRPAYVTPSQIELSLTLTNAAGKKVTLQPAGFKAEARRHYIVTIGVNGSSATGNMTLDVQFDEEVVAETVEVPLGDELFEAPAPSVVAKDFTAGETLNAFESFSPSGNPRYEVYAFGGLKEVTLTLNASSSYNPPFGNEVQLVNASDIDQANVMASGLDVKGLFRNPDKMGIVGLKGFLEKLPIGTHKITLIATDALTRVSDPVELNVIISAVEIKIEPVANMAYLGSECEIYLSTNSPDVRDRVSFKVTNNAVDAEILEIADVATSGDVNMPYKYKYRLKTPELKMQTSPLWAYYGPGVDPRANTRLEVEFPKFSVEVDPFAKKVKLRVVPENPADLEKITRDLVVISNGTQVNANRIQKNLQTGIINVFNVNPGTTYGNVKYALANVSNPQTAVPVFTTETETPLYNGDFSIVSAQAVNFGGKSVQIGSRFITRGSHSVSAKSSIDRKVPDGWSSLNVETCYTESSNANTWYVVPSTFLNNGEVIIRTVGYSHAGKDLGTSGGAFDIKYYGRNCPGIADLNIKSGELFLGSYLDINNRTDGVDFSSRPLTLSFKYKYTSYENEQGEAYIKVYNELGEEISQGVLRLPPVTTMTTKNIELGIYDFGEKAAKIEVCFKSTATSLRPSVNIPTGDALSEGFSYSASDNYTKAANDYKAFAMGSELVIDDVVLGYDPPALMSGQTSKPKHNPKRR